MAWHMEGSLIHWINVLFMCPVLTVKLKYLPLSLKYWSHAKCSSTAGVLAFWVVWKLRTPAVSALVPWIAKFLVHPRKFHLCMLFSGEEEIDEKWSRKGWSPPEKIFFGHKTCTWKFSRQENGWTPKIQNCYMYVLMSLRLLCKTLAIVFLGYSITTTLLYCLIFLLFHFIT